jgi:alpha-galactosidase
LNGKDPPVTVATSTRAVEPLLLESGGLCVVLDVGGGVPRVLHWGPAVGGEPSDRHFLATLAESQKGADGLLGAAGVPAVLPEQSAGWIGTPGLDGHREGAVFSTAFASTGCSVTGEPGSGQTVTVDAVDPAARLSLVTTVELTSSGVLRLRAAVTNDADDSCYTVNYVRVALPVPSEAQELLDFAGRHLRERTPQRRPFAVGTHLREGRRGRTGSDATLLLAAGTPGFGFRHGEVWAVHTAWSGNHATYAELGLSGVRVLGGGEVLLPGEMILAPGETYTSPWLYASYGEGLDALAASFHRQLRARPIHRSTPRPVVLNTWEAVYFGHDLASLVALAELGAKSGAERFVLDDGWFLGRRDDRAGLGDWQVDPAVWPDGLGPLVQAVRGLGMDFGLWVEPEMVNEDSEVARAHPEWLLAPGERLPLEGRHQQVLNLTIPEAFDHVLEAVSALVAEYAIDYVKWDHNRDLVEAGDRRTGAARVHEQTLAAYALMDELRRRHPGLEIESCSSGGGRVDLEVLQRTDRVWASDCIDPLERQRIQRWTSLLLPHEIIGSHVGAPTAHTTGRTHSLAFRAATALFGHFGIEWDLRTASPEQLQELAAWVALYKEERALVHGGTSVHSDYPDDAYWAHGVVAPDRRRALFAFVGMETSLSAQPGRIRLPGLDADLRYRLEPIHLSDGALTRTACGPPSWWTAPPTVSGRVLKAVGLQAPMLYPEQALLFRLIAAGSVEDGR